MITMNKEIGGFFELELNKNREYHRDAIRLNSARYCLQYILKARKYRKIYIPYYICNSILQPIIEEDLEYEFYGINENFEPNLKKDIGSNECLLYVNYFGSNSENTLKVSRNFKNIIIDNTQAFFERPLPNVDTIYSPRKFFGVPDGGYLYIDEEIGIKLEDDVSYNRFDHLLKRIDISASDSYNLFRKNEEIINKSGMKNMSSLTRIILSSIDYENCKKIRNNNFYHLHKYLNKYNNIKLNIEDLNGCAFYPFITDDDKLKDYLIENKIYVATYWSEVLERVKEDSFEYSLVKKLVPLPIDQRYNNKDMDHIVGIINKFYSIHNCEN